MKVREVMTTDVACVRKDDSLDTAARLMWDCDCGSIPVKEADSERVIGMITDRDICMATWSRDRPPSAVRVSEAMSAELHFSSPDETVSSAEKLMRSKQVRRVPVLDDGHKLVGILSLADIATASQRKGSRAEAREFTPADVGTTLAGICQPRGTQQQSAQL